MNYNYKIAASAPKCVDASLEERNVFAIYVSYYIKVKLTLSGMGGEVTLKLPFILGHIDDDVDAGDASNSKTKTKQCDSGAISIGSTALTASKIVEEDCGPEQIEDGGGSENDGVAGSCSSAIVANTMFPINKIVNSNKHEIDSIKSDIISIDNYDDDDDDDDGGINVNENRGNGSKLNASHEKSKQYQLDDNLCQTKDIETELNVNVITAQVHNSAIQ